jgi:CDP-diacylglycerol--glycerol-3-phosphate 3-phosphatidyltransferase
MAEPRQRGAERRRGPRPARGGRPERPLGDLRENARNRLIESRLTPNAISMTGLVLNLAAAVLILDDRFVLGAIAFIVGSIMDTLDGRYSRMSGKGTQFGAFLDSTLDRIEEGVVLAAVCWQFAAAGEEALAAACLLVVLGSLMVSYTRARAEALGVECKLGIATRPVRVVVLSAGLLFAEGELIGGVDLLPAAIWVMLALTAITVLQRVWHVRRQLLVAAGDA